MPILQARRSRRVAWLVACVIAPLLNPMGPGLVDYIRTVQSLPIVESITPVWRPLAIVSPHGVILLTGCFVVAWVHRWSIARITSRDAWRAGLGLRPLLPLAVLVAASFDASRYVQWAAIFVAVELAHALAELADTRGWKGRLTSRMVAFVLVAPVVAAVLLLIPGSRFQDGFARLGLPESTLLRPIKQGTPGVVLASAEWADYVRLRTSADIVIDARLERYTDDDLASYVAFRDDADLSLARTDPAASWILIREATAGDAWDEARQVPKDSKVVTERGTLYRY